MIRVALVLSLLLVTTACMTPGGNTVEEKRADVRQMRDATLEQFYARDPKLREKVARAPGYAVFSDVGLHLFVLATGNGYGIAVDRRNGRDTFMRMGQLGAGIGMGAQSIRVLFIFQNEAMLTSFVDKGWSIGSDANAGLVAGNVGGTVGGQADVGASGASAGTSGSAGHSGGALGAGSGVETYQLTESGIALEATLTGTKYWKDGDLN
jgi:lipid-binding SYLF domain-containing protein